MKLIVGLGNPGKKYENTRHNIGFFILDSYLKEVNWKDDKNAFIYKTKIFNEDVIFIKPTTFMNLSGVAVSYYKNFYKISLNDILIIHDDMDLEIGSIRLKKDSSSGGHNGIKSIIKELKTDGFARLKIGIGKNKKMATDKYVLSEFSSNDLKIIKDNFDTFNSIIDEFIQNGCESTMKNFN